MERYLKHLPSGLVYVEQLAWLEKPDEFKPCKLDGTLLHEVTDEEIVIDEVEAAATPKPKKGKKVEPAADESLAAEASRGL